MRIHALPLAQILPALGLLGSLSLATPCQAADLTVSAAVSLSNAFRALAARFEAEHADTHVLLNFAASDALLAQITKGAPVDVFASADQDTMDKAATRQLIDPASRENFVRNRLVLITPLPGGLRLKSLADLSLPEVHHLVMGRPEGVPAGRYARAALQEIGLWPALESRTIFAQNVRQALDYVVRGEVEAGFVYATDAALQVDRVQVAFEVPTGRPITYPVAAIAGSPQPVLARQFIHFLASPSSQAILAGFGFEKP